MTTKYTSEPWKLDTSDSPIYVQRSDENDSRIIAVVPVADELTPYVGMGEEESVGNAHLLVAAPDMRAALRAILFQVIQGAVLERDACITQARAALAKAEGRA